MRKTEFGRVVDTTKPNSIISVNFGKKQRYNALRQAISRWLLADPDVAPLNCGLSTAAWLAGMRNISRDRSLCECQTDFATTPASGK